MFGLLKKVFGTQQSRLVKRYAKLVPAINRAEVALQSLSDEELKGKTEQFRRRLQEGEKLDDLLIEAYAVVKNACRRLCGSEVHVSGYTQRWDLIPYDVQILGAIAMYHGAIAEMHTGEGKTLTASMPLYLHALTGKATHLVTVNDYLAKRDCEWIGVIFRFLGMKSAALTHDVPPFLRRGVYEADIVYGTASEFGFDYLRDNSMASSAAEQVQRGHYFAMVDEIDSVLIDEARTPLIISGPMAESRHMYDSLKDTVAELVRKQRDLCNQIGAEAKKKLDTLGLNIEGEISLSKLSKEQMATAEEAFKQLWVVSKGTPRSKVLKRVKEHPDLRAAIERWETYYFGEQNKEEKQEKLSSLLMIVDERTSDYELTDKGILAWSAVDDFVMLDLGHEYAVIEGDLSLGDAEKIEKKLRLREEDALRKEKAHNLRQLLRAHLLMERDIDYIVHEAKIVIIDENTGRPQPGRRFSDGLHQAIEAKEGVEIQAETQTYATITLQNYFRLYDRLAGMTGTAMTEAHEFKEIYKLDVLEIPTHRVNQRKDYDDEVYMTEREKYVALVKEIRAMHETGRPLLIGTESVEVSEKLSRILRQNRLEHTVLNAKQHDKEAEVIADAGARGAITIATNMAGRGTDIKLKEGVAALGGLHVIGTARHPSRRIDRQLRGRSARQGDPGSSKFFVSFEDSLMRLFASPRMTSLLQRFRPPEGEPISAKVLNKSIETAQKRIEQRNYTIRKHTLEYDNVMNVQRKEVYSFRNEVLHSGQVIALIEELIDWVVAHVAEKHLHGPEPAADLFCKELQRLFPVYLDPKGEKLEETARQKISIALQQKMQYQMQRLSQFRPDIADREKVVAEVLRGIIIRKLDSLWIEHLTLLEHLRSDVSMRTVGQKDPLLEFKHESFTLFAKLSEELKYQMGKDLFRFELTYEAPVRRKGASAILGA